MTRAEGGVRRVARTTLQNLWDDRVYWLLLAPVVVALWVNR